MSGDDVLSICISSTWFRVWWARKHFSDPSQCVPSGERDWNQYGFNAGCARDGSKKFLVGVDARATALEDPRLRLGSLDDPNNRLRHIFHIRWLQSHQAAAEQRIDWEPAEKRENGGEKRIVRSEHDGRSDDMCVGESSPDHEFTFTARSDVP